ncbi:hypothetical protein V8C40DRAFT_256529 [Trichoderma camerunense]
MQIFTEQIQHLPIQSQYIIGKQHQLKQHIQPQRHSSQYNPLTITTCTPSSTSITRYLFSRIKTTPTTIPAIESSLSPYAGTTHQSQGEKEENNPAISPLDPASSSPSPTWKRNDKKEGPETRPPIAINSETNVAMHFRSIQKH